MSTTPSAGDADQAAVTMVVGELRSLRTRIFEVADMFPVSVFPPDSETPEGKAGVMARHVAQSIGIWVASRIEELTSDG